MDVRAMADPPSVGGARPFVFVSESPGTLYCPVQGGSGNLRWHVESDRNPLAALATRRADAETKVLTRPAALIPGTCTCRGPALLWPDRPPVRRRPRPPAPPGTRSPWRFPCTPARGRPARPGRAGRGPPD